MKDGDDVLVFFVVAGAAAWVYSAGFQATPFDALFRSAAAKWSVDENLLRAIAWVESRLNARAVSPPNRNGTKDYGLMQINEATARALGVPVDRLLDPEVSIDTAARLLSLLKKELGRIFSLPTLVSAYNAGSPTVLKSGIVNPDYVGKVLSAHVRFAIGTIFR